ncbi:MAG TPA: hypothetical protein PKE55_11655 [Kiritimatiellia bacterium]|nr:hypothetical protein [Kiritimatiellia bacterium]
MKTPASIVLSFALATGALAAGVRDIATTPFFITAPGHYAVVQHIVAAPMQAQPIITVSSPDVVLDLNGFTLDGNGSTHSAILIQSGSPRVTIRNGFIANCSDAPAIRALTADIHIEDISFRACVRPIFALARARIEGCMAWGGGAAPSSGDLIVVGNDASVRDTVIHGYTFGAISSNNAAIRIGEDATVQGCVIHDLVSPVAGTGVLHGVYGERNASLSDAAFFHWVRTNATGSVRASRLAEDGAMRRVAISAPAITPGWSPTEVTRVSESTSAFTHGYRGASLIMDSVAGAIAGFGRAFSDVDSVNGSVAAHAYYGYTTRENTTNHASYVRSVARNITLYGFYAQGRFTQIVECLADRVTGDVDSYAFNHAEVSGLMEDVIHCHASNSEQGFRHVRSGYFAGNSASMNVTNQFNVGGPTGARGVKFPPLGNNFIQQYPRLNFEF